ncbi:hypothetical protein BUALT_Bualt14G0123300 [Buddleja alternifolia]|uniref:CG-1 domain-containing protein n=1 Tax=Buddleja alternifolia TaxID=168488 RepID=A0AAV6WU31_9LAMI|nr:hypothetical protein BUALT_Bualt14G0123300 [Buddleja alternifolia]
MENNSVSVGLVGSEINGFRTMEDLDVASMMEEAKTRWLRPNEIHAILCNHKHFTVNVKPVNLPKSGRIVLFDRKMLRNFRKDGHNWKKKKDGKTVKEAHEHLKLGNEERIHVYYAHGEDNPTFVRRCYWLLDKSLEHIVLVHYRDTQELQGSSAAPVTSNSSPAVSDLSTSWPFQEESDCPVDPMYYGSGGSLLEHKDSVTIKNYERRMHELNTLEWDDLLVPDDPHKLITPQEGKAACFELPNQFQMNRFTISDDALSTNKIFPQSSANFFSEQVAGRNSATYQAVVCEAITNSGTMSSGQVPLDGAGSLHHTGKEDLQAQDSFGRWITSMIADSPESVDNLDPKPSISTGHQSFMSQVIDNHHPSTLGQIFNITDVSPAWALSTEETKILVVGSFKEGHLPHSESKLFVACGDSILPAEVVQEGVFRCLISPQTSGFVNLYLTFDGHKPISQVLTFEFRAPVRPNGTVSNENKSDWQQFQLQMRLAHLLFSSSKTLSTFSTKISQNALKEAKAFTKKNSRVSDGWVYLTKMIEGTKMTFPLAKDSLFELTLQNRLHEWLLEKVVTGCKIPERDEQGQGVIHLCAILGYTWAIYPFSCSGLSLDYRDKFGWTALHFAAYYGREKMVATLLSAGAKPNLVTDPTPENPGGSTASDLASRNGYDGLAAYLAEKALIKQFEDMTMAGNVSGSLQTNMSDTMDPGDFNEDEIYLKDTLAAYRTAADAAARIHAAFRERELKVRTEAAESFDPEMEARNIVAAMRIQHAFRNYETRKKISAAARIQYRFRTWKMRKDFLNMRRQAIRIQAVFRGFQARRQYRKIVWSVGILEKAVLRWRMKRKGFRGLEPIATVKDPNQESDVDDDFFQASRKQAEERVERSVVKVQAMFRSRQAQEEYRRMKLEHNKATLEYEGLFHPDTHMG